jgi:hypothetical protein
MTSGVKYGLGPTLPHMAGVILGFGLMIAVVGLGVDILFQRFPQILPPERTEIRIRALPDDEREIEITEHE